ncbi:hypothetical protein SUGI_0531930 [Cryptomeria japonica]|nr:hypothetical protein SUGI_0531930 [Cryptomeria japonica]
MSSAPPPAAILWKMEEIGFSITHSYDLIETAVVGHGDEVSRLNHEVSRLNHAGSEGARENSSETMMALAMLGRLFEFHGELLEGEQTSSKLPQRTRAQYEMEGSEKAVEFIADVGGNHSGRGGKSYFQAGERATCVEYVRSSHSAQSEFRDCPCDAREA